ncbi:MAG: hypothetical protein C4532_16785 [Candidatus Abyssobacteria bacterium SURF_17]|uniref:HEAT repeat domain-containing protein n=1 Tax=Candidatus Abyssobacteria bacterium SURF_17 TaxID=2093361 RepID=A0A419ERA7_9BACT|nr:MAG: hypothetical protein C4532_16785 [Candidatus Abyssubacteria bacterium SURF_17]
MLFWKEWREILWLVVLSPVALCAISFIRWEGWRPEFYEFQFWVNAILFLPLAALFLGAGAMAAERERGTFDSLLARPVSLLRVFVAKFVVRFVAVFLVLLTSGVLFCLLRPTHNIEIIDLVKGFAVFLSGLFFLLAISLCASCLSDTQGKAFIASITTLLALIFVINYTPFFKYTWWWRSSSGPTWVEYAAFYVSLSIPALMVGGTIFMQQAALHYRWRVLAVVAVILVLIFVRSVSTTFSLFAGAASSGDLELVQLARSPVYDILAKISSFQNTARSQQLREFLVVATRNGIERDLIKELSNSDPKIRAMAIHILEMRKSAQAAPAVTPLLKDQDREVRYCATMFVQSLKYEEAMPALLGLLDDPVSSVRERAVSALAEIEGKDAGPRIMPLLDDENPRVRVAAALSLGRMDYGEAADKIAMMMFQDPVDYVRRQAAISLRYLKSSPACDALIQALEDDDSRLVENVVYSLGELRCEAAVGPLVDGLRTHLHVAQALKEARRRGQEHPLRPKYGHGKVEIPELGFSARYIAAMYPSILATLVKIDSPAVKQALRQLFTDFDRFPQLKLQAAIALAELGDATGIPYIRERLAEDASQQKPGWEMREHAMRLAKAGEYSAVPLLIPYLDEGWPEERYMYGQILEELTGKKYGWDSKRWRKWWEKNKDELLSKPFEAKDEHRRG